MLRQTLATQHNTDVRLKLLDVAPTADVALTAALAALWHDFGAGGAARVRRPRAGSTAAPDGARLDGRREGARRAPPPAARCASCGRPAAVGRARVLVARRRRARVSASSSPRGSAAPSAFAGLAHLTGLALFLAIVTRRFRFIFLTPLVGASLPWLGAQAFVDGPARRAASAVPRRRGSARSSRPPAVSAGARGRRGAALGRRPPTRPRRAAHRVDARVGSGAARRVLPARARRLRPARARVALGSPRSCAAALFLRRSCGGAQRAPTSAARASRATSSARSARSSGSPRARRRRALAEPRGRAALGRRRRRAAAAAAAAEGAAARCGGRTWRRGALPVLPTPVPGACLFCAKHESATHLVPVCACWARWLRRSEVDDELRAQRAERGRVHALTSPMREVATPCTSYARLAEQRDRLADELQRAASATVLNAIAARGLRPSARAVAGRPRQSSSRARRRARGRRARRRRGRARRGRARGRGRAAARVRARRHGRPRARGARAAAPPRSARRTSSWRACSARARSRACARPGRRRAARMAAAAARGGGGDRRARRVLGGAADARARPTGAVRPATSGAAGSPRARPTSSSRSCAASSSAAREREREAAARARALAAAQPTPRPPRRSRARATPSARPPSLRAVAPRGGEGARAAAGRARRAPARALECARLAAADARFDASWEHAPAGPLAARARGRGRVAAAYGSRCARRPTASTTLPIRDASGAGSGKQRADHGSSTPDVSGHRRPRRCTPPPARAPLAGAARGAARGARARRRSRAARRARGSARRRATRRAPRSSCRCRPGGGTPRLHVCTKTSSRDGGGRSIASNTRSSDSKCSERCRASYGSRPSTPPPPPGGGLWAPACRAGPGPPDPRAFGAAPARGRTVETDRDSRARARQR